MICRRHALLDACLILMPCLSRDLPDDATDDIAAVRYAARFTMICHAARRAISDALPRAADDADRAARCRHAMSRDAADDVFRCC